METEDKIMIGYVWFITLLGALIIGNDLGMVEGARVEREANKQKLESCQVMLNRNLFQ